MNIPNKSAAPGAMGGHNDEVRKPSFWISQFFVLLATVLGVYLAATQGFNQAINFDNIQSDKKNYYLRKSLHNELASNVVIVREYLAKVKSGSHAQQAPTPLNTFVWESMKFSDTTLETPSDILGAAQNFYRQIPEIQSKVGNLLGVAFASKLIEEQLTRIESETLPALEKSAAEIEARLHRKGINV